MSSTASLSIKSFNVDHSERISRDNTSLVEREAVLALSFSLVHEGLVDVARSVDSSVCIVLDGLFLFLCQRFVVSDVNMCLVLGLLSTSLPNMGSKNLFARCKDNVSARMMCLKLRSTLGID